MAGTIQEKLYPPIINGSIPAFCIKNGTANLAVPFSVNRAVSMNDVGGFRIKIKTVQSNLYLASYTVTENINSIFANRQVIFSITPDQNTNTLLEGKIKPGQFLKIQLAFIDTNNNVGYFSTVGIVKYTTAPNVYIHDIPVSNYISSFRQNYIGIYETGEDKSERPYSYCFYLYDNNYQLVETSGWKIHNSSINANFSESLSLDQSIDTYTYETALVTNEEYYIQYGVKTINGLEVYSQKYACMDAGAETPSFDVTMLAENVFEEGYIALNFIKNENAVEPENGFSIEISRTDNRTNFSTWRTLKRVYFINYNAAINWQYKDFTIEQGVIYRYSFRQYTDNNVYASRVISNDVLGDFEDMFLWDGYRQLKIRFNPKVSSFKTNYMESKIDTIGSRYPFIFRNGVVDYKEFPVSGLISYLTDNNELFIKPEDGIEIIFSKYFTRQNTPVDQEHTYLPHMAPWETAETLDSVAYNTRAERQFKLLLLQWLGNGKIKLFRSPAEGNYLVRMMNISLTPEDKLGRMLHTFSATAYEVEELTYENLTNLGFINSNEADIVEKVIASTKLGDLITLTEQNSYKFNSENIYEYLKIEITPNTESGAYVYLRLGADKPDNKVLVRAAAGLTLEATGLEMPDVYFNAGDNGFNSPIDGKNAWQDIILTYQYQATIVTTGDLNNIEDVKIKNKICSYIGPFSKNFITPDIALRTSESIIKFLVVDFKKKGTKKIIQKDGLYYDFYNQSQRIYDFNEAYIYEVYNNTGTTLLNKRYVNNNSLVNQEDNANQIVITVDGQSHTFTAPPILDLNGIYLEQVQFGSDYILDCACQVKTTTYKEEEE